MLLMILLPHVHALLKAAQDDFLGQFLDDDVVPVVAPFRADPQVVVGRRSSLPRQIPSHLPVGRATDAGRRPLH